MGNARANALIRKQKQAASKSTKERRRDAWEAMADILKEKSEILMNTQLRVRNLEENKVSLLVLYCELEIFLAQCTGY